MKPTGSTVAVTDKSGEKVPSQIPTRICGNGLIHSMEEEYYRIDFYRQFLPTKNERVNGGRVQF